MRGRGEIIPGKAKGLCKGPVVNRATRASRAGEGAGELGGPDHVRP